MKISVITNGISQDYETCCKVMNETGVKFAELQEIYGKRVEYLSLEEMQQVKEINDAYGITPVSITTHAFAGINVMDIEVGDEKYNAQLELLQNGIRFAKLTGAPQVRVMPFAKTMVLFGAHGADQWNAGGNKAWPKFLELFQPIVELAEKEEITFTVENGFNAMLVSAYQCRKFMEEINSDRIQILWDPANALYYGDVSYPDAYEQIKGLVGHIHIKDLSCSILEGWVDICPIGQGMMAPYLERIKQALDADGYNGYVSLENIYRPDNGDYIDGYYRDIPTLKRVFGG